MQCVDQSLNGTCVLLHALLFFLLGWVVSGSCSRTPVERYLLFFIINSVSFRLLPLQLHSILFPQFLLMFCFLLFHPFTMLPALLACGKRFDHLLSLPAENWTCVIEASPHVHCVRSAVHVQLDHRSISRIPNVRIVSIQHDNVSGSDNVLH